jgi:hypothetical protein
MYTSTSSPSANSEFEACSTPVPAIAIMSMLALQECTVHRTYRHSSELLTQRTAHASRRYDKAHSR